MKSPTLEYYETAFGSLSCHKQHGVISLNKPALLLSVLELIEGGNITANIIPFHLEDLEATYNRWWKQSGREEKPSHMEYPFMHLASEGFWKLHKDGVELPITNFQRSFSRKACRDLDGARLEEQLWDLLQEPQSLVALSQVLKRTYFAEDKK